MKVDGIYYHGSQKLFDKFETPKNVQPGMQLGFGIHLAKKKEFAALYGPNVYRCRVKIGYAFSMNHIYNVNKDHNELAFCRSLYYSNRKGDLLIQKNGDFVGNVDVVPPAKAVELLQQFSFTGVIYTAQFGSQAWDGTLENVKAQSESVVCLYPLQISILSVGAGSRGRFA